MNWKPTLEDRMVVDDTGQVVCILARSHLRYARLIAAAPRLQAVLERWEQTGGLCESAAWDALDASRLLHEDDDFRARSRAYVVSHLPEAPPPAAA